MQAKPSFATTFSIMPRISKLLYSSSSRIHSHYQQLNVTYGFYNSNVVVFYHFQLPAHIINHLCNQANPFLKANTFPQFAVPPPVCLHTIFLFISSSSARYSRKDLTCSLVYCSTQTRTSSCSYFHTSSVYFNPSLPSH